MKLLDIVEALEERTGDFSTIVSPFRVDVDATHCLGATNGHGIVMVELPLGVEQSLYGPLESLELLLKDLPRGWRRIDAGAIGELCPSPVETCPECEGTGLMEAATPELIDPNRCTECRGRGRVPNLSPSTMVQVGGATYNARLIRWYCGLFPAVGHVEVADVAAHDRGRTLWLHYPGDDAVPRQYVAVRPLDRSDVIRVDWL